MNFRINHVLIATEGFHYPVFNIFNFNWKRSIYIEKLRSDPYHYR